MNPHNMCEKNMKKINLNIRATLYILGINQLVSCAFAKEGNHALYNKQLKKRREGLIRHNKFNEVGYIIIYMA